MAIMKCEDFGEGKMDGFEYIFNKETSLDDCLGKITPESCNNVKKQAKNAQDSTKEPENSEDKIKKAFCAKFQIDQSKVKMDYAKVEDEDKNFLITTSKPEDCTIITIYSVKVKSDEDMAQKTE